MADANFLSPIDAPDGNAGFGARVERIHTEPHESDSRPGAGTPEEHDDDHRDMEMHHMDEPPSTTSSSAPMKFSKTFYDLVDNQLLDSDKRSLLSRPQTKFDYHESRRFLFKVGVYRFFVTLFFCILIAVVLKAFEGFKSRNVISKNQVRLFNAIMLGLSLGLGLNLASSLKRYAVILRWSLLTKRFVSLEVFDLILGLETLTKVGKLMIISLPRIRKSKMLRKLPWFREARDDGSRLTWIVCLVWLLVNIGAQVLVATLSLFWPVDTSDRIPLLTRGDVLISDLASWKLDSPGGENASALASANTFGVQGVYDILPADSGHDHRQDNTTKNVIYQGDGYYEYRFLNRNPNVPSVYLVSERVIQVRASCQQLTLDESGVFKHTNGRIYGNASLDGKHWELYPVPFYYEGSISWVGSRHAYCGSRCTNFTVFQKADDTNITVSSLFTCKNEVSLVQGGEKEFINLRPEDHDHIYSSDDFARIAAGAISWTGYTMANRVERQTRIYFTGEEWSPYKIVGADEVSDMIMRFSISAIAAFDDHGIQYIVPNQLNRPVQGQIVNADWGWILGLLGGICIIQFGALICLVAFANKAIIRDESFFSTALLLRPVVEKIGKGGVNLTGRDIKNHPKLRWRRIKYDYEEGRNGEPNEVRIKFEGSDLAGPRRSWAPGDYR